MMIRRSVSRWRLFAPVVALVLLAGACTSSGPSGSTAPVTPSVSTTSTPPATTPVPLPTADWAAMKAELTRRLKTGPDQLRSVEDVVVSVGGKTVLNVHQGTRTTPDSYRHIWSVTKSVVSILVGIAVAEGRLSLDQPLTELLPAYRAQMDERVATITLRQLLTMTSGIPGQSSGGVFTLEGDDPVGLILTYGVVNDPGSTFDYSNAGAHLVAAILRQATGTTVLEYARQKLFDPLGIPSTPTWEGTEYESKAADKAGFAWAADKQGVHSGCCGLRLRTQDLVKIGQLYADGGRWQGRQLVPETWVRESTSAQVPPEKFGGDSRRYGYLWGVYDGDPGPAFYAEGSYGHLIWVDAARRLVVVLTCRDSGPYEGIIEQAGPVLDETIVEPLRA